MKSKYFDLGTLVQTTGVYAESSTDSVFSKEIVKCLARHCNKDWGDLCEEDAAMNDEAVQAGEGRLLSSYKTSKGKLWIITEHDRTVTTILFPHEY